MISAEYEAIRIEIKTEMPMMVPRNGADQNRVVMRVMLAKQVRPIRVEMRA